jgi:hypothetical protein
MSVSRLSKQSIQAGFPKQQTVWDQLTSIPAMEAISSVVITASNNWYVNFTGIPQTYTHLQLRAVTMANVATNPSINFNNDSTGSYTSQHFWSTGTASASNYQGASSATPMWSYNPSTTYPAASIIDIYDYTSTAKSKIYRSYSGSNTNGSTDEVALWGGVYNSTNAITTINLYIGNGSDYWQAGSTFTLYGIK